MVIGNAILSKKRQISHVSHTVPYVITQPAPSQIRQHRQITQHINFLRIASAHINLHNNLFFSALPYTKISSVIIFSMSDVEKTTSDIVLFISDINFPCCSQAHYAPKCCLKLRSPYFTTSEFSTRSSCLQPLMILLRTFTFFALHTRMPHSLSEQEIISLPSITMFS